MNPTTTTRTTFRQRLLAISGALGVWSMVYYATKLDVLGIVVAWGVTMAAFALIVYMTENYQ